MIEHLDSRFVGQSNLDCISGEGSLLILLPMTLVEQWEGSFGLSKGSYTETQFRWAGEGTLMTDYDRAAEMSDHFTIKDYFKPIPLGDGVGIVISEDYPTVWLPSASGGTFVRLTGTEREIFPLIPFIEEATWSEPLFEYHVNHTDFALFDPAYRFNDSVEHLPLHLKEGRYSASTVHQKIEKTQIIMHRLIRL